jgi:hypothetical protein
VSRKEIIYSTEHSDIRNVKGAVLAVTKANSSSQRSCCYMVEREKIGNENKNNGESSV